MNEVELAQDRFSILDRVPIGMCVLRRDFSVLYWNRCLEAWTGFSRKEILGVDIRTRYAHLGEPMISERLEMVFLGGPPAVFSSQLHPAVIPYSLPDGSLRRQHASATGVSSSDKEGFYALLAVEDVSDLVQRVQDYRQMRDLAREEADRRKQAEEALRKVHDELEVRVAERTAELAQANQSLRTEVAERAKAEENVRELKQQIEFVLEATNTHLDIIDSDFTLRYVDPGWEKTYGKAEGRKCYEYFMGRKEPCAGCGIPVALRTKEITVTEEVLVKEDNRPIQVTTIPFQNNLGEWLVAEVNVDISERKRQEGERTRLATALEQAAECVIITDLDGVIQYVNPAFEEITGYLREEAIGQTTRMLDSDRQDDAFHAGIWDTVSRGEVWKGHIINKRKDGQLSQMRATISPVRDPKGNIFCYVGVHRDVTNEMRLMAERNQAQRLEAMGQLAAGIAHEINTPAQYVGDNTRFLREEFGRLVEALRESRRLLNAAEQGAIPAEVVSGLRKAFEMADIEYLCDEIPKAIQQTLEGIGRVTKIVRAMKEFSHPGAEDKTTVDLNKTIESTVTVCRNEWKYVADLTLDLDPGLPLVNCRPGDINQVILNLVINAAHAIESVLGDKPSAKGSIVVSTRSDGDFAEIRVSDTGCGIPEAIRSKIFDLFFTTKEVGRGTGQGLAIARDLVVGKHGGTIDFETEEGKGTTFIVRLPFEPPDEPSKRLQCGVANA